MSELTIFAVPKSFEDPHIAMIQANAIKSWTMLKPEPRVLLICDDDGVGEAADQFGCEHVSGVRVNAWGFPIVSDVFKMAKDSCDEEVLCYVNADVVLMQDFVDALDLVQREMENFLMVGQRWDWRTPQEIDFRPGWRMRTIDAARGDGRLHNPFGIEFFAFSDIAFPAFVKDFILGWYAWDGWILLDAIRRGVSVVDVTRKVFVVHQHHIERLNIQERQSVGSDPRRRRNLELAEDLVKMDGTGTPAAVTSSAFWMDARGRIVERNA